MKMNYQRVMKIRIHQQIKKLVILRAQVHQLPPVIVVLPVHQRHLQDLYYHVMRMHMTCLHLPHQDILLLLLPSAHKNHLSLLSSLLPAHQGQLDIISLEVPLQRTIENPKHLHQHLQAFQGRLIIIQSVIHVRFTASQIFVSNKPLITLFTKLYHLLSSSLIHIPLKRIYILFGLRQLHSMQVQFLILMKTIVRRCPSRFWQQ